MPVVTTLMARGAFPDSHDQHLGMPGMHGTYHRGHGHPEVRPADRPGRALRRPRHRPGLELRGAAPRSSTSTSTRRSSTRSATPTSRSRATSRRRCAPSTPPARRPRTSTSWWKEIRTWQERYPLVYDAPRGEGPLRPQHVIEAIAATAPRPGTIVTVGRRPAPDVGQPVLGLRGAGHVDQLRWRGHDGFRRARRHRRQGRAPRPDGVVHRRRRLLPDDRPGARHGARRRHPDQGRHPQQRLPRHGAPMAGDVLRRALQRGLPVAGPARLRQVGRGDGLRRPARAQPRGDGRGHRAGQRDQRRAGRDRLPHRLLREGVPDGRVGASNDDIIVHPRQRGRPR